MLQERDHGGRHRHHLARRDVHVVDTVGRDVVDLATLTAYQHPVVGERAVARQRLVGLGDDVPVLLVGREVVDLFGDLARGDLAVRRLDETERVDPRERRESTDQTDVRTLGRLDRAHAAVVRRVHIPDLEAGPLPGQTARAERTQPPPVGQSRQRVGLVHELGELRRSEELLDGRHHGPDIDQGLRRDGLDVLGRHPLPDDPLHAGQSDPDLVLDQLTHGAQATVAEVVDVVGLVALLAGVQAGQVLDGRHHVGLGEGAGRDGDVEVQLLVELVPADARDVVPLRVEEQVVQQRLGVLPRGRLTRSQLAVDVQQRLVLAGDVVLLERGHHELGPAEPLADLLVGPADGLEQDGDRLPTLTVDADADRVALVDVELEPCAAARDDLDRGEVPVRGLVGLLVEVHTRRADELAHHHTLGAVDDERALRGHDREVTHEHRLALDLASRVVGELRRHEQRGAVGEILLLALLNGRLHFVEAWRRERERHRAGEVLNRTDLFEDLRQPATCVWVVSGTGLPSLVADQPVEGVGLDGQKIGDLKLFGDPSERDAAGSEGACLFRAHSRGTARRMTGLRRAGSCQDASFRGPMVLMAGFCAAGRTPRRNARRRT